MIIMMSNKAFVTVVKMHRTGNFKFFHNPALLTDII